MPPLWPSPRLREPAAPPAVGEIHGSACDRPSKLSTIVCGTVTVGAAREVRAAVGAGSSVADGTGAVASALPGTPGTVGVNPAAGVVEGALGRGVGAPTVKVAAGVGAGPPVERPIRLRIAIQPPSNPRAISDMTKARHRAPCVLIQSVMMEQHLLIARVLPDQFEQIQHSLPGRVAGQGAPERG